MHVPPAIWNPVTAPCMLLRQLVGGPNSMPEVHFLTTTVAPGAGASMRTRAAARAAVGGAAAAAIAAGLPATGAT